MHNRVVFYCIWFDVLLNLLHEVTTISGPEYVLKYTSLALWSSSSTAAHFALFSIFTDWKDFWCQISDYICRLLCISQQTIDWKVVYM